MLLEATIVMFVLMGITWVVAVWASNQDGRVASRNSSMIKFAEKKAA